MFLTKIAEALDITLNDLYGIENDHRDLNEKINDFPKFSQNLMKELFYEQLSINSIKPFIREDDKIHVKAGCTLGAIYYTAGGAAFISERLSVISSEHDLKNGGNIFGKNEIASGMKKLCDTNVRKILNHMYSEAFKDTPSELSQLAVYFEENDLFDAKFYLDELSVACNLSEEDALEAIEKLISVHVVQVSHENDSTCYIFQKTKAVETAVVFAVVERLVCEQMAWGCGYLIGHGTF